MESHVPTQWNVVLAVGTALRGTRMQCESPKMKQVNFWTPSFVAMTGHTLRWPNIVRWFSHVFPLNFPFIRDFPGRHVWLLEESPHSPRFNKWLWPSPKLRVWWGESRKFHGWIINNHPCPIENCHKWGYTTKPWSNLQCYRFGMTRWCKTARYGMPVSTGVHLLGRILPRAEGGTGQTWIHLYSS